MDDILVLSEGLRTFALVALFGTVVLIALDGRDLLKYCAPSPPASAAGVAAGLLLFA